MSSCRGSICHVTSDDVGGVKAVSLGHMTDFIYDSTMDHIKVDYKEVGILFVRYMFYVISVHL